MATCRILLPLLFCVAMLPSASAKTDRVSLVRGGSEAGELVATSPKGVTLEQRGETLEIPVTEIKSVRLDGEPPQLEPARLNYNAGGYETALEGLRALTAQAGDDLVGQEVSFYTALCEARLAIAGAGDLSRAYDQLFSFVRQNRDSFHFYEAVEMLGKLKAAAKEYEQAEKMYVQIAKAPFRELQLSGRLLAAGLSQIEGKQEEAVRRYDAVLRVSQRSGKFPQMVRDAKLGKAISLALSNQLDVGLGLVKEVLQAAAEEDDEEDQAITNAAAYNALGRCYEAAGQPTDALFAYLHTDLLFNGDTATHAEALSRLAELWKEAGKPDAARDARQRLLQRYAGTQEARQAG